MKKSLTRKLTLQRETLRLLEKRELEQVGGAAWTDGSCYNSCDPYTYIGCPSRNTCTSANC